MRESTVHNVLKIPRPTCEFHVTGTNGVYKELFGADIHSTIISDICQVLRHMLADP